MRPNTFISLIFVIYFWWDVHNHPSFWGWGAHYHCMQLCSTVWVLTSFSCSYVTVHCHPSVVLLPFFPTFCSFWMLVMTFPFSASMGLCFRVYTWVRTHDTCLSVPGLFHLLWWLPIPFVLSHKIGFHSFFFLTNWKAILCIYAPHFHYVFICWGMFVSISCLLCIVLQ